jgi:hypothetical protein
MRKMEACDQGMEMSRVGQYSIYMGYKNGGFALSYAVYTGYLYGFGQP